MWVKTTEDKFITLFYALVDAERRTLQFTNAGHNAPVLTRQDGTQLRLEEGGLIVGAFQDSVYRQGQIDLRPANRLVMFTDGNLLGEGTGGGEDLTGAGAHPEILGQIHPAHGAGSIEQKFGRPGDVLPIDSGAAMEQVVTTDRFASWIGKKRERVASFATEVAGDFGSIHADGHGANPSGLDEFQILFDTP